MADDDKKDSGIELDKLDLTALKRSPETGKKHDTDISKTHAPEHRKIETDHETGTDTKSQQKELDEPETPDITPPKSKKKEAPESRKTRKKNYLILCAIIAVLLILSFLAYLDFNPGLLESKKNVNNKHIIAIRQKAEQLNESIQELNTSVSSKVSSEDALEINLRKVESALNGISGYNKAVAKLLNRNSPPGEPSVFYEAKYLYQSDAHDYYISGLKDCLFSYNVLLKYRIKYHVEIMEGKQVKRLTYERYLLDYKIQVKQLNSSHMALTSLINSKIKANPELEDIYYYYIIPEWMNLSSGVKFLK